MYLHAPTLWTQVVYKRVNSLNKKKTAEQKAMVEQRRHNLPGIPSTEELASSCICNQYHATGARHEAAAVVSRRIGPL